MKSSDGHPAWRASASDAGAGLGGKRIHAGGVDFGSDSRGQRLKELAAVFLKLGCIGFGGPAAHVGLMENELVRRQQWLSREKFMDLLAATNLIPGPNSTEMAIFVGYLRAGFPGLIVAGLSFIVPAVLMVLAIAWATGASARCPRSAVCCMG